MAQPANSYADKMGAAAATMQRQGYDMLEDMNEQKALMRMYPEPGIRETFVSSVQPQKSMKQPKEFSPNRTL